MTKYTLQDLKKYSIDPTTSSEKLTEVIESIFSLPNDRFRNFFLDKIIINPNISFKDWIYIVRTNFTKVETSREKIFSWLEDKTEQATIESRKIKFIEQAFLNPAIELWLLEDLWQWKTIEDALIEIFIKTNNCPSFIKNIHEEIIERKKQEEEERRKQSKQDTTGSLSKYIFPIQRQIFGSRLDNDLVSVQPISNPMGALFLKGFYKEE